MELNPNPYPYTLRICPVYINAYARFDQIPLLTLQDIEETLSMHIQKQFRITKGNKFHRMTPSSTFLS